MAIEDNTLYGLTGAQIKELPGKIEAVKGLAKTLTTDDYDYPTNDPTSVAVWKLASGIYVKPQNVNALRFTTASANSAEEAYIVMAGPSNLVKIISSCNTNATIQAVTVNKTTGGIIYTNGDVNILTNASVQDSLTSTSTTTPLSAKQGKVLKDLIDSLVISGTGAPTTSTAGIKGKLYEDTTNGKLYQCTNVSGNTYTWTPISMTNITSRTSGSTITSVQNLDLAGDPSNNKPYALKSVVNGNEQSWGYIRGNISLGGSELGTAYAGVYDYDGNEDLWRSAESRLALYSDLPTVPSVVQTTGTSQTDVMSQNAVTNALSSKTTLSSKIQANVNTPISSLNIAGNGTDAYPYAPCYYEDSNSGRELWSYIRAYPIFGDITQAYVGKYGYDAGESYWNGKKETRLALYSDLPATFTTNEWNALWA